MPAELLRDVDLAPLSTFHLPARAAELAELHHSEDLPELLDTHRPALVLGGGSNTLFVGDIEERIILNRLRRRRFEPSANHVVLEAGAGESWHGLVVDSVERGLWGIENLALIPGSTGAAPMQNIGAYGVELADRLDAVEVFDRRRNEAYWMSAGECNLGYRTSRFKHSSRFVILSIRIRLSTAPDPRLDYPALAEALDGRSPESLSPADVADAVMAIRRSKLPDPADCPNAGSFFKNPIVDVSMADILSERHEGLPKWPVTGGVKLSAAWLIDRLGWRGRSIGGAQVYPRHALVLTNTGNATGHDVLTLARSIRDSVAETFGVELDVEPRLIGGAL
jgi:UDP-N-acetylmuramate dehydrogenase